MPGIWGTSLKIQNSPSISRAHQSLARFLLAFFFGGELVREETRGEAVPTLPQSQYLRHFCKASCLPAPLAFRANTLRPMSPYQIMMMRDMHLSCHKFKKACKVSKIQGSLLSIAESTSDAAPFFLFLTRTDQRKKC